MKHLSALLPKEQYELVTGSTEAMVTGLALDSRQVVEGGLFAAIPGTNVDGHQYIRDAVNRGASVIIYSDENAGIPDGIHAVKVANPAWTLAMVAHNFYDRPSDELEVVGVTGTNGKTSACSFLHQLFTWLGYQTGLIATTQIKMGYKVQKPTHTTPNPIVLAQLLRQMADSRITHVFMEVSSHALVQERVTGINFRGGVFTNITHEHLDYHGSFQAYIKAKQRLFKLLPSDAFALTNKDDKRGLVMTQESQAKVRTYALQSMADYQGKVVEHDMNGMQLQVMEQPIYTPIIGAFNASNILLTYAVSQELGVPEEKALKGLSLLNSPAGRLEILQGKNKLTGIVDYAHSPDALMHVLATIQEANKHGGRIVAVIGCGGDRDTAKRPEMIRIALTYATQIIITSDNPRTEDPAAIAKDMKKGAKAEDQERLLTILDREEAIRTAVKLASEGDIILVAGKGHEKFQEVQGAYFPFDDKAVLAPLLNAEQNESKPIS